MLGMYEWLRGRTNLAATSWPITSTVGRNTSKLNWPLWSLASASSIVLNVVSSTLHRYFLAKALRSFWLM